MKKVLLKTLIIFVTYSIVSISFDYFSGDAITKKVFFATMLHAVPLTIFAGIFLYIGYRKNRS